MCCGRCIKRAASTDIDTNVIDKILLTRNEMKIIYNMIFLNYIYLSKLLKYYVQLFYYYSKNLISCILKII